MRQDTLRSNGNGRQVHWLEETTHNDTLLLDSASVVEQAVYQILSALGEDPEREGLQRTPRRVAKSLAELLEGYQQDLDTLINGALFDVEYGEGEMIVVSEIPYQSMCEHHMLPFSGKAHVAYIPGAKVVGLSKIPRIVDMFSRRLQVQERITQQIADALIEAIDPAGVMVLMEGVHSCAILRGVKKHTLNMKTVARRGAFSRNPALVEEFHRMIAG